MIRSNEEFHIAGVVVRCRPERFDSVREALSGRPGIEVHRVEARDGLFIATVETSALDDQVKATKALLDIPGVVDVDLVYHAFDHVQSDASPEEVRA